MIAALAIAGCAGQKNASEGISKRELAQIKHYPKTPTVRILLMSDTAGALVDVKGPYNVYDPRTGKKIESDFSASSYYMYPTTEGIKWGSEFPGTYQLLIVPDSPNTSTLIQGTEYRGIIYAYQIKGTIGFVNEVSLDDYAESAVSDLTDGKVMDKEALAALAIAARSDAWFLSEHSRSKYWDIKASDVGYRGAGILRRDNTFLEAMRETSGMVIPLDHSIDWFERKSAPVNEIQNQALDGKHARGILNSYFPNAKVIILDRE